MDRYAPIYRNTYSQYFACTYLWANYLTTKPTGLFVGVGFWSAAPRVLLLERSNIFVHSAHQNKLVSVKRARTASPQPRAVCSVSQRKAWPTAHCLPSLFVDLHPRRKISFLWPALCVNICFDISNLFVFPSSFEMFFATVGN